MRIDAIFLLFMSALAAFIGMLVKNKRREEQMQTAQAINAMPPYAQQQAAWVYHRTNY